MKKALALILALTMVFCLAACGSSGTPAATEAPKDTTAAAADAGTASGTTHNVGMTISSLSNVTWAAQVAEIESELKELGWGFTCVVHDEDPVKATTQIENFVNSNCDIIIINGCTTGGVEDAVAAAQAAGVKIVLDASPIEGVHEDVLYVNDNYGAGYLGGVALGEWFNEVYGEDHKAIIGAMTYGTEDSLIRGGRTKGQIEGLESVHPNYEVVAWADVFTAADTMTETENMLSAHPDIEAILNWGDSMALGCLEAARGMGIDESKFAIISIDGTVELCREIAAGSAIIQSTSLGGPTEQGADMVKILLDLVNDNLSEDKTYYSPNLSVTRENVEEFLDSSAG